ncbi:MULTISPECIES: beta-propeller fold lactonase family protein [unclassified Halomonas]|uniref:lactonase family protein n=1 Tax=unclassified Halomonas TaxID=2609666 RepID=UPI00209E0144|nr:MULTISPECIES: beta-propeller fold lactonase family protein [unclassified Halomonas]MCP1312881.1 beta-propeller fold lactonase family protein [Halomonas sp. 707D7]MCP1325179.1 beta-propeller fold lactonase family protein [Halomonas sp. 707D4]
MTASKRMLYVGCALSGELYSAYLDDETGKLELVSHRRLPGLREPGGAMPLCLTRDRSTLYAVSRGEPFFVARFGIDAEGALTHQENTPLDTNLAYIETSTDDTHLLCASFIDHHVSTHLIDEQKRIAPEASYRQSIEKAHALCITPGGKSLLGTSLGKDVIYQWTPSSERTPGELLEGASVTQLALEAGTGPRHIACHPTQPVAYVIGEHNGTLSVVRYGEHSLALLQTAHLAEQPEPFQAADVHLTPDGRFLYASEKATSTLHLFTIAPDASITFRHRFPTENRPRGFAITADGRHLIAAGQFSHHIASYRIDPESGHLTLVDRLPVGQSPDWIEIA